MIRIVILSAFYPISIGMYFEKAFRSLPDIELLTVGPYYKRFIPWLGGMDLRCNPTPPNVIIPSPGKFVSTVPFEIAENDINTFAPDAIINVDFCISWDKKPNIQCPIVHIATDPHFLMHHYRPSREWSDYKFNMQSEYMTSGDLYLPYAIDHTVFFPERHSGPALYDGCMICHPTEKRDLLIHKLQQRYSISYECGPILDEYRCIVNNSSVGLNWSVLNDLNCRVFETMGMGIPLITNKVPGLDLHFKDGLHYYGFNSHKNGLDVASYIIDHAYTDIEIQKKAKETSDFVMQNHTFVHRAQQIIDTVTGNSQHR